MTDRRFKVILDAEVTGFQSKMVAAGRTAQTALKSATDAAENQRASFDKIGRAAGLMGAAAAAGFVAPVMAAAKFDTAMSKIQAATGATGAELDRLREAAMQAGADTSFSASEAAAGIENLAKAGVSTADIMSGGLTGALSLAAAGELDVADAAEITATALAQFGLAGSEAEHVADLLAAGAGKAQGDVSDMSAALNQAGLVANATGLSIEETTATLAAFANQGLIGSDAGTSLKTMLQSLTPTTVKAQSAMEMYGISAYDATGTFIGMEEWAGRLAKGLGHMSDEQRNATMKTVFGSDAVRAANAVYEEGANGIASWTGKVNDAGFAAQQAETKMDNLAGDLERLKGSLETALIGAGSGAQGPLREVVQILTEVVNLFSRLPAPVQGGVTALAGLAAVMGGGIWVATKMVTGLMDAKEAMRAVGLMAPATGDAAVKMSGKMVAARVGAGVLAGGLMALKTQMGELTTTQDAMYNAATGAAAGFAVGGPWGAAIGAGVGVLTAFGAAHMEQVEKVETLTGTLDAQTGALTKLSAEWLTKELRDSGATGAAAELGIDLDLVTDAAVNQGDALATLNAQLDALETEKLKDFSGRGGTAARETLIQDITLLRDAIGGTNTTLSASQKKWKEDAVVTEAAADSMGVVTEAEEGVASSATLAAEAIADQEAETAALEKAAADLSDALDALFGDEKNVVEATDSWKAGLRGLREEVHKHSRALDNNTDAGQQNRDAISGNVDDLHARVQALLDTENGERKAARALRAGRDEIIANAKALGFNGKQLDNYLTDLGLGEKDIEQFIRYMEKMSATDAEPSVGLNAAAFEKKYGVTKDELRELDRSEPVAKMDLELREFAQKNDLTRRELQALGLLKPTPKVGLDDSELRRKSRAAVAQVNADLGNIENEEVSVSLSAQAEKNMNWLGAMANGGIMEFYARGGLRENHVAQIAPANAVRVWAEPETEGEAYIPLAGAKRKRSMEIWKEVGKRFGILDYANGAVVLPDLNAQGFPAAMGAASSYFGDVIGGISARLSAAMEKAIEKLGGGFTRPLAGYGSSGVWGRYSSGGSHPALDFPAPRGTPIRAVLPGKVAYTVHSNVSYGNHTLIEHPNSLSSLYGHQQTIGVNAGEVVGAGQPIGTVNSTGNSTGDHLHLEVRRNGSSFDYTSMLANARMHSGGMVGGDDELWKLLQRGEYVTNAKTTAANLPLLAEMNSRQNAGRAYQPGARGSGHSGHADGMPTELRIVGRVTLDAGGQRAMTGFIEGVAEGVVAGHSQHTDTMRRAR